MLCSPMARRPVSKELWQQLQPLIPAFVPSNKGGPRKRTVSDEAALNGSGWAASWLMVLQDSPTSLHAQQDLHERLIRALHLQSLSCVANCSLRRESRPIWGFLKPRSVAFLHARACLDSAIWLQPIPCSATCAKRQAIYCTST